MSWIYNFFFGTKWRINIGKNFATNLVVVYVYNSTQFFLLDVNYDKSTFGLYFLLISSMFVKFLEDQKSISMLSNKYLNFKFL